MRAIRKIIIGKEITESAMNYTVGQNAVKGKYTIDSILQREEGNIEIYIKEKNGDEILVWKNIHKDIPCVLEYSQDFS